MQLPSKSTLEALDAPSVKSGRGLEFRLAHLRLIHLSGEAALHFVRDSSWPGGGEQLERKSKQEPGVLVRLRRSYLTSSAHPSLAECVCLARRRLDKAQ